MVPVVVFLFPTVPPQRLEDYLFSDSEFVTFYQLPLFSQVRNSVRQKWLLTPHKMAVGFPLKAHIALSAIASPDSLKGAV